VALPSDSCLPSVATYTETTSTIMRLILLLVLPRFTNALYLTSVINKLDGEGGGHVNDTRKHAREVSLHRITSFSIDSANIQDVPASEEDSYVADSDVGSFVGECTCPNGQTYKVGAIGNDCNSLACDGGKPGTCYEHSMDAQASGMKVTCARLLPRGKRWIFLTRGQAFRAGGGNRHSKRWGCEKRAYDSQLACSQTFVDKVIEPLENLGNTVTVVFTSEPCTYLHDITAKFGRRLATMGEHKGRSQADGVRFALDTLNNQYGGPQAVAQNFDYVVMLRNDLCFFAGINSWLSDFDKFNFFFPQERGDDWVWDFVHVMPSRYYPAFNSTSTQELWCGRSDFGHFCYRPVLEALRKDDPHAEIGFIYDREHWKRNPYVGTLLLPLEESEAPASPSDDTETDKGEGEE